MNLYAKCMTKGCPAKGRQMSVILGQWAGYGKPNDRIECPLCHELMRTSRTIAQDIKGTSGLKNLPRRAIISRVGTTSTKPKKTKVAKRIKLKVAGPTLGPRFKKPAKKAGPKRTGPKKRI